MTAPTASRKTKASEGGKLRIGDDWNAIRIIALSQSNPLKAIAEFVENSIDAHAKTIVITRGREAGADQRAYRMTMSKGDARYKVTQRRVLFGEAGTELRIGPLARGAPAARASRTNA